MEYRRYLVKRRSTLGEYHYIIDAVNEHEAVHRIDAEGLSAYKQEISTPNAATSISVIEIKDDGQTTPEYWDCECLTYNVKPKSLPTCSNCGATSDDCPDSRLYSVPHIPEHLIHSYVKELRTMAESCETTSDYWDCECEDNYIKPKSLEACSSCESIQYTQPDSRGDEVQKMLDAMKTEVVSSEITEVE